MKEPAFYAIRRDSGWEVDLDLDDLLSSNALAFDFADFLDEGQKVSIRFQGQMVEGVVYQLRPDDDYGYVRAHSLPEAK